MDVRGLRALVCLLVVVGSIAFVPFGVAADAGGSATGIDAAAVQEERNESAWLEEADEIHVNVVIHENGSATFTVDHRYAINGDDGNESNVEWETLREDVESNSDAYTDAHADDWQTELVEAENRTEREMELMNVSVRTDKSTAPRTFGHVTFTFTWNSFAHVELNRIEAGDSLSGFTLSDGTTLQFRWPEGYETYDGVDPSPDSRDDRSVFWNGEETEFTNEQPRLILIENASDGEAADTDGGPPMPWLAVAAALLLLAAVGAAGWWIGGERGRTGGHAGVDSEPIDDPSVAAGGSNGPPPELLSNEERVLRLLNRRGGRIKQQEVVSELDWTEAKTSQVVSRLREDDQIDVFRIGRENVLSLPDDEEDED
ncbi:helix-turn-helix transcriptional regulator [Halosolutus gelatinilyticus]|uniref:helix-turn-helix transcriptional regulator n=1 Tax=Halosolutus gelatinilyticus TaxID=2931975 RepID=UPI001FF5BC4D|nr:hypothetical protein [Halosolutus gelatinilyticus]